MRVNPVKQSNSSSKPGKKHRHTDVSHGKRIVKNIRLKHSTFLVSVYRHGQGVNHKESYCNSNNGVHEESN